jgi:hypothetical protein
MNNIATMPGGTPGAQHLDGNELITEIEAARMRCQSVRTLQMERLKGGGCRYVKLGRSVRYRRGDVTAFIADRVVSSTTEADAKVAANA